MEESLQETYSEDVEIDLATSQVELSIWMDWEEQRLAQQAKQSWLIKGEASPLFFRAMSRRNQKEAMEMKLDDGYVLTSPE